MNSALALTMLIVSMLMLISTSYSLKNKNVECYQGTLTIALLISAKVILYCMELLFVENKTFVSYIFAINASLTPVIASLVLLSSLAASSAFSHSKGAKKTIGLLAFFFVGLLLTNPFHELAFTLNSVNTINSFEYAEGLILHISKIYAGICILSSFIVIAYSLITSKMYCRKTFAFIGTAFSICCYFMTMYVKTDIPSEAIMWFSIGVILFIYVFINNDFNFIPVIKDNTFELINDGMLVVNKKYLIKDYNKSLTKLFSDIDFTNVIGKKIDDVFKFYPVVIYAIKSNKNESVRLGAKDYTMLLYNSLEKRKRDTITTVTFKEATTISIITDRENSNCDPLTKLKTKDDFYKDLAYEFDNSTRYNLPFIIAIIELSNLYKVKEEHGEIAGDLLLTDVSTLIKREIRKTDVLARIDSNQFALLITHTNVKFAENICERIREKVEKHSLAYEDKIINSSVIIGTTGTNTITNQTVDTFIKLANDEILKARKENKSCVKANFI